jgi:hypothetical protein
VSAVTLLAGLLVLAYLGSILVGGRAIRGYGLPSGSEYVLLGFVVGPHVLGAVDREALSALDPLAQVGLGWLALTIGVDYGYVGERRVPFRRLIAGLVLGLVSGAGVAIAFVAFAQSFTPLGGRELFVAAVGVGAVSCETTRHAVQWVVERYSAKGPLADLVADIADADDIVPLAAITVAFAAVPSSGTKIALPYWALSLLTLGGGVVLGILASALLRVEERKTQTWGILLGAALAGAGIAARLGKASLGLLFALGITVAALSGRRAELRKMVGSTEHAILLPVLVLAGANVDLKAAPYLPALVGVVLVARVATKWLSGQLLRVAPGGRRAGAWLGLGLMPSGALTMAFGLAFALRFDDAIGHMVLVVAAAITLFGELVGPTSLRLALKRAGEIEEPEPRAEPPRAETEPQQSEP